MCCDCAQNLEFLDLQKSTEIGGKANCCINLPDCETGLIFAYRKEKESAEREIKRKAQNKRREIENKDN